MYDEDAKIGTCADCGHTGPVDEVKDLSRRLEPGDTVPIGQCSKCGALANPAEREADEPSPPRVRIYRDDYDRAADEWETNFWRQG